MSKKKLLIIGLIILLLIAIPATIYVVQMQQETRSRATASTTLTMTPGTSTKNVNDTVALQININPGSNLVSFVSLDITYDPTKLEPVGSTALEVNKSALPIILQGPVYSTGRIRINLSTGNDPTSAIKAPTSVGTLTMKAIGGTGGSTTSVAFGSSTQILSVAGPSTGSNDSAGENVLSTSTPALITIAGGTAPSPTTIATGPTATTAPTAIPTATRTPTPSPTRPATQPTSIVATATVTPTRTVTPTVPAATATRVPTSNPTAGPTLIAQGPTSTSAPTPTNAPETNSSTAFTTSTPTPTLAATGPSFGFIGVSALVMLFIIGGSLLFFTL